MSGLLAPCPQEPLSGQAAARQALSSIVDLMCAAGDVLDVVRNHPEAAQ
jgi:hypothetical protein